MGNPQEPGTPAPATAPGLLPLRNRIIIIALLLLIAIGDVLQSVFPDNTYDEPFWGPMGGAAPLSWQWWLMLALLLGYAIVLWNSGRKPWVELAILTGLVLAAQVIAYPVAIANAWIIPLCVPLFLMFLRESARVCLLAVAALIAAVSLSVLVLQVAGEGFDPGQASVVVAFVAVLPIVLALTAIPVRMRRELISARNANAASQQRQEEMRREAVEMSTRAAMARELHDIAAHHLSGMVLASAALPKLLADHPDQARDTAQAIHDQSRVLLGNIRQLVGLLREGEATPMEHTPTLTDLESLIHAVRLSGVNVTLEITPDVALEELTSGLGPLAQLSSYRVVQEALANVARHAGGAECKVAVDGTQAPILKITVTNGPGAPSLNAGESGGFGLIGMKERAELTGATLAYGPRFDEGWEVHMEVPRENF